MTTKLASHLWPGYSIYSADFLTQLFIRNMLLKRKTTKKDSKLRKKNDGFTCIFASRKK